jgi:hypothetical protein
LAVDIEPAGDFGLAQTLVEESGGFEPPLFQLIKITLNAFWIAHAQRLSQGSIGVTILYEIQ